MCLMVDVCCLLPSDHIWRGKKSFPITRVIIVSYNQSYLYASLKCKINVFYGGRLLFTMFYTKTFLVLNTIVSQFYAMLLMFLICLIWLKILYCLMPIKHSELYRIVSFMISKNQTS